MHIIYIMYKNKLYRQWEGLPNKFYTILCQGQHLLNKTWTTKIYHLFIVFQPTYSTGRSEISRLNFTQITHIKMKKIGKM